MNYNFFLRWGLIQTPEAAMQVMSVPMYEWLMKQPPEECYLRMREAFQTHNPAMVMAYAVVLREQEKQTPSH